MAKTKGGHSQSQSEFEPRGERIPPTSSNRKRKEVSRAAIAEPSRTRQAH